MNQRLKLYTFDNYYEWSACPFTLCRGFFTPKIVGTFYMQGYKVKEKTAIVPPVSKLSGHPGDYDVKIGI